MSSECDASIERLASALCNGAISAEETAQLDALLVADADARAFFNDYLFLHGELYSLHAAVGAGTEWQDEAVHSAAVAQAKPPSRWQTWLAVAAALVGVSAVSSWLTFAISNGTGRASNAARSSLAAADGVARITASRNCAWSDGNEIGYGSRLKTGQQLKLLTGLVEVTFDDGAVVVLEGPATFDVRSQGQALLHDGRLAAMVPEQARGFEVLTSRLNVVDLGTEFGVMADSAGAAEVHVFNGLVKAHVLDEAGREVRTVELNTAEAARIEPAAAVVARIPARDDEFVRSLSVAAGPHDGLLAYDGFNYPAGPLDEQNGGFGWAGPWFAVESESKADASSNGVRTGNLQYEGLIPLGNHAAQAAEQNRIRRALGTNVGGVFDAAGLVESQDGVRFVGKDGTIVYLSFLQRVDKINDVFYGFELHRGDGNANRVLCIGSGVDGTGYGVTSNVNVYGQQNFPSLGKEHTGANFFVVRITFGQGNRDRVEVIRNPRSLIDESACEPSAELSGNFAFDRISLGNFHGTKIHEVDEIRVGTTFRAVTGRRGRGPDRLAPRVAGRPLWQVTEPWSKPAQCCAANSLAIVHR